MITRRENLFKILRGEAPEWTPICGHCDPYNQPSREGMDPELAAALGQVQWQDESTVLVSRRLGIDIMDYLGPPARITQTNVVAETSEDGPDAVTTWRTPAGDLREVRRQLDPGSPPYRVEHMVKGPEDLPALAAVFEDQRIEYDPDAAARLTQRQELIGEDGMLMCFLPGTPMGMMYRVYSGVAALAYLHADAPAALRDLFAVMERTYRRQFELAAGSAADALVGMDDTSTTVISPAMFETFNMTCTDERAELCGRAGKLYFHHSCGLIRDLLPLYRQTGMDAVHAFTTPPVGDVTIAHGQRELGDRITVIAGVAPLAEPEAGAEQMRAAVRDFLSGPIRTDRLILNLAAYPHKTMAQTAAVAAECRECLASVAF